MASLVKSHLSLEPGEIQNQEKGLLLNVQWGTTSAHYIFCYAWWPHSALIAAACAHQDHLVIMVSGTRKGTRAWSDCSKIASVFRERSAEKHQQLSMEEGNMGNYRHRGESDGSVMRKTGGRTPKERHSKENSEGWQKTRMKGIVSLRSG